MKRKRSTIVYWYHWLMVPPRTTSIYWYLVPGCKTGVWLVVRPRTTSRGRGGTSPRAPRRAAGRFFTIFFISSHFYFPAFGQAVVTSVVPSSPRFLPSIFNAHRVQQSLCSSIFHRVWLIHALALSASHKRKSQHIHTSMHSAGLELAN